MKKIAVIPNQTKDIGLKITNKLIKCLSDKVKRAGRLETCLNFDNVSLVFISV